MVIPAARQKFYRHINGLIDLAESTPDAPERLVQSLIHLWQERNFPLLLPARAPRGTAPFLTEQGTLELADWLCDQPFNEAAYWLASAYSLWVGKEVRAQRALFFTPPRLADRVISNLINLGASLAEHHWHDPACGGAAFLVPIAQRMAEAFSAKSLSPLKQLQLIERRVSGNDLDPALLGISKSFLEMALYPLIEASGYRPKFQLFHGDGLTSGAIEDLQPDVIACNPPYRKLKAAEVMAYRAIHSDVVEGQPNVYGLFINRTLQLIKTGGLIGLLTPTSFLSGKSFSKLRSKILSASNILQLDMLSDRTSMFIDVEQETAITILRTRNPSKAVSTHTEVSVLTAEGYFDNVGSYLLPNSGRPWPIPRAAEDAGLLKAAEAAAFRLSDYGYKARVGNLVAYRDKRRRFICRPVDLKLRNIIPLVWATDIAPDGTFEHGRESRHARTCAFVQVKSLEVAGVIKKPAVLLQRLTSSDQRSRLVAAAVPAKWIGKNGGYICENHVIVLEPISGTAIAPDLMAGLLNTRSVDRVFRSISGASNVAVSELNELLLPDPRVLTQCFEVEQDLEAAVSAAYSLIGR